MKIHRALHPTSERVWRFIACYVADHNGTPPVTREIMDGCGLGSTSVVAHHLSQLENGGYLTRDARKARTIRLTKTPRAREVTGL